MARVRVNGHGVASVGLENVAGYDAVVLLTPHTSIDYDRIIRQARLVVDTHSGLRPRDAPNVVNVWVPSTSSTSQRSTATIAS
jgi:hypothetical protein